MGPLEKKRSVAEIFDLVPKNGLLIVRVVNPIPLEDEAFKRNRQCVGEIWSTVTLMDRGLQHIVIQRRERWADTPERILAADWRNIGNERLSHWAI